jgi:hypothetical protein
MGRQAATVVFPEVVIAIAIVTVSKWELETVTAPVEMRRVH